MSKYNAKKVIIDGITFDSQAEGKYYEQLKWLKANKQIKDFEIQPVFCLQEAFKKEIAGKVKSFRKIEYRADFKVIHLDKRIEIIDIKGMITPVFQLKHKIFERKFPYELTILKYVKKYGGFIEINEYNRRKRADKGV